MTDTWRRRHVRRFQITDDAQVPVPAPEPEPLGYVVAASPPGGRPALTHTTLLAPADAAYELTEWQHRESHGWAYRVCAVIPVPP